MSYHLFIQRGLLDETDLFINSQSLDIIGLFFLSDRKTKNSKPKLDMLLTLLTIK